MINEMKLLETIQYVATLVAKTFQGWAIKLPLGFGLSFLTFFFDSLQKEALVAVLVLIVMDFASAVFVAYKVGEQITSANVFRTAVKIAVYYSLIAAGFVAEKAIPIRIMDDTIITFLAATELVSLLENASKAGYGVPQGLIKTLRGYKDKK